MSFDGLPFVWTAEMYGTHNAHMDEEHAGLFTAIDRLDKERSLVAFEDLAGLVVKHFADEEELGLSDAHKVNMKKPTPLASFLISSCNRPFTKNWLQLP